MGRSLMTFRGNWSALSCRWVLMLHRSSPEGVADPYRSTAEIVLTSELFWLRRRCAGRFRVDLPAQGIAAEQGHITIEYCACSFRGKRDHRVSDFLVAELVAYLQTYYHGATSFLRLWLYRPSYENEIGHRMIWEFTVKSSMLILKCRR